MRKWPHTGVILTGGARRRIGAPTEGVRLPDGRPMLAHMIDALRAACRQVVIAGACREMQPLPVDIRLLADHYPGLGPLAGIEAALSCGLDDRYLIVACDQPLLCPELLRRLTFRHRAGIHLFAPDADGLSPFPGVYPAAWLPVVQEALESGTLSVRRLLAQTPVVQVPITPEERARLAGFSTPEEVERSGSAKNAVNTA